MRDPDSIEPDDFLFTTDPSACGAEVAASWAIEVCSRDTKQDHGGEDPQSWKRKGPNAPPAYRSG